MRKHVWIVLCLLALVSEVSAIGPQVTLTGLTRAKFIDSPSSLSGDGAVIKFLKDPSLLLVSDPTCGHGTSSLAIRSSIRSSGLLDLPCTGWSATRHGFRFESKTGEIGGIRKIDVGEGKLVIKMKGGSFTQIYGPVTFVEIALRLGDVSYCGRSTAFDRNDAAKVTALGPSSECLDPTATPTITLTPSISPTPSRTPVPYCGDGIRQIDEQCDDGNDRNDDCCYTNCHLAPAASSCASDGNVCTTDQCDANGLCQHLDNSASCDDGSNCTSSDSCSHGTCGGSLIKPWINEVNYDGYDIVVPTRDHEEFVEIAGPAGLDLSGYKISAVEGAGLGNIFQPCLTGSLNTGEAYFTATLPSGTVIHDDTGKGTGFVVVCFADTSDEIEGDGKCDVVLGSMPSHDSNLPDGALSNLFDCADGILLRDSDSGFVDAVSYEGTTGNSGPLGGLFSGAPNIGRDWGLPTDHRRSLIKTTDNLQRETNSSNWADSGNESDSPGAVNGIQNLSCYQAPGYTNTHYPIVLLHGLYGFDSLFGVVDYWNGIPEALAEGGASVFVITVSQLNSPQARGDQAIPQIEQILAQTGKAKVNLVGHSQGAVDARYIAGVRPDLIASVTAVAGPHKGAELADFLAAHFHEGAFDTEVLAFFGDSLGMLLAILSGSTDPNDGIAAVKALTSETMAQFNQQFPAGVPPTACGEGASRVNGIYYFSWTGTAVNTNVLDPTDALFDLTTQVFSETNDGLVGRCSSHLGDVIRDDYNQNHIDEVNLLFGLVSPFDVDPKVVYRMHANRLKNLGL